MSFTNKLSVILISFILCIQSAIAAPEKIIVAMAGSDENSTVIVDHSAWQKALDTYLSMDNGQALFNYRQVDAQGKKNIEAYIQSLVSINPLLLNRKEQKAYWMNLYNSVTINIVLDEYPVTSITKIGKGLFSFGPWKQKIVSINQTPLSLDNIEHGILRPLYNDPRIHYGVNCASIGCPNLLATAFTGENTEQLLDQAAKVFINHPRAIDLEGNVLTLSKIYEWFQVDFGNSKEGVIQHIKQYADNKLRNKLNNLEGKKIRYDYDWSLNEPALP